MGECLLFQGVSLTHERVKLKAVHRHSCFTCNRSRTPPKRYSTFDRTGTHRTNRQAEAFDRCRNRRAGGFLEYVFFNSWVVVLNNHRFFTAETPRTTCPFQFFAQLDAVDMPEFFMKEYESEIQNPTGLRPLRPPKLSMKGVLVSKECGIMYEIGNVTSTRCVRSYYTLCRAHPSQVKSFLPQDHQL